MEEKNGPQEGKTWNLMEINFPFKITFQIPNYFCSEWFSFSPLQSLSCQYVHVEIPSSSFLHIFACCLQKCIVFLRDTQSASAWYKEGYDQHVTHLVTNCQKIVTTNYCQTLEVRWVTNDPITHSPFRSRSIVTSSASESAVWKGGEKSVEEGRRNLHLHRQERSTYYSLGKRTAFNDCIIAFSTPYSTPIKKRRVSKRIWHEVGNP